MDNSKPQSMPKLPINKKKSTIQGNINNLFQFQQYPAG